jgi:hypothetical protein
LGSKSTAGRRPGNASNHRGIELRADGLGDVAAGSVAAQRGADIEAGPARYHNWQRRPIERRHICRHRGKGEQAVRRREKKNLFIESRPKVSGDSIAYSYPEL